MSQLKISECIKKIDQARGVKRQEKLAKVKMLVKTTPEQLQTFQQMFGYLKELIALFEKTNKLRIMSPYNKFQNIRPTLEAIINSLVVPAKAEMGPIEKAADDIIAKFTNQCRVGLKWAAKNIQQKEAHAALIKQAVEACDFRKPINLKTIYALCKAIEAAGVKQPKGGAGGGGGGKLPCPSPTILCFLW